MERTESIAEEIGKLVAESFRITEKELYAHCRSRKYSYPRMLAMYLIREITRVSYPVIGRQFGIHHTSVMHACRWATTSPIALTEYREYIEDVIKEFKS